MVTIVIFQRHFEVGSFFSPPSSWSNVEHWGFTKFISQSDADDVTKNQIAQIVVLTLLLQLRLMPSDSVYDLPITSI